MSDCDISAGAERFLDDGMVDPHRSERSDEEEGADRLQQRRETNRVAAQRSRKRQIQRADQLHQAYECLERTNSQLKREVAFLLKEQSRLMEVIQTHEALCPIRLPTSSSSSSSASSSSCCYSSTSSSSYRTATRTQGHPTAADVSLKDLHQKLPPPHRHIPLFL